MEGDALSATVGVLVQNLINLSKDEISLTRGRRLEKEAEKLRDTFGMAQSFLDDALERSIDHGAVRGWLQELEDVVFDADNVLNEVNYQLVAEKIKKKKMASCCFSSLNQCLNQRKMARRINRINTQFESINKLATELGLQEKLAVAVLAAPDADLVTDPFIIYPIFVGRDDHVSKIVQALTTPVEQVLSVLPIVGMGGLGKTALAQKVFNHEIIKTHFRQRIWVHVSQKFDVKTLLKKILANLQGGLINEDENTEGLLKTLQQALKAKTYLLVLDDVWNEDPQKWEDFIRSCSEITSTMGNCIIVTTRSTGVGSLVKSLDMHYLNDLSDEECWSIIKDRAFKGVITPDFEAIGRSIAELCQGLPLAAIMVGGVLRDKPRDEWLWVKENWLTELIGDENYISRILRLSYDYLPSPSVKKCFAYCSVFPKGSRFEREDLIELWMAEGFLNPSPTSDMENLGDKLVDLLVRSSLLQVVDRDKFGNIKGCSMHYFVHDLAASVLGFSKVNDNTRYIHQARYICWQSHGDKSERIPKEQAKRLRTLFYEGEISDIMFSNFQSLHALTLRDDDVEELPDSIKELMHLRYLNISSTNIKKLPDSIGELRRLQTFDAHNRSLKKLPRTFKQLLDLRHLHLLDDAELPHQLGMFTSLRTLPYFKVREEEGHRIVELGSLENLKGELKIDNLEIVRGEQESKKAYLVEKPGIVRLVLRWDESRDGEINDEHVLKGLQPHPNLRILEIVGFKGARYPSWTLKMEGFHNLIEMRLERCEECEEIPTLGHLPRLQSLYLSGLRNVKSIGSSFYGVPKETIDVFPALERLELMDMPSLTEWVEVEIPNAGENSEPREVKVFPCLEYLKIKNCQQLRSVPSHFPCLKLLKIKRFSEMVRLPDLLFHNSQNISVLEIKNCPKLQELPDGLQSLNSLQELSIHACENLKSILYSRGRQISQGRPTLLRRLSVDSETTINFPREILESWAPSLEVLQLWGRPIEMQMLIELVHRMPRLEDLTMDAVPKFIIPCDPLEAGSLRNLKTFIFYPDGLGSWDCASFNKAADGILRLGCSSLQTLELAGNFDWESLPDQLQHLTALSELHLYNFGIEELPEWFGNLSSLAKLRLSFCKKLKGLPSVEVMRRLNKLSELYIFSCPLLKKMCTEQHDDDGSEWLEISRSLTIQADGQYIRGGRIPS